MKKKMHVEMQAHEMEKIEDKIVYVGTTSAVRDKS
jgi:hypothetical protein